MTLAVDITGGHSLIDESVLAAVLSFAAERVSETPAGDWTLTVVLADVGRISELHRQYFDDPSPTDVISFPSGDDFSAGSGHLGDIVVCVDVAAEQAAEVGHSLQREVVFLALHGLLHVVGYDDAIDQERERMLRLQAELLDAYEERFGRV